MQPTSPPTESERCPRDAWDWILISCLVLGLALRVHTVAFDRSLWLDELFLWKALGDPNAWDIFHPLSEGQVAAPGYLWMIQALRRLFGDAEWVLRLPSLTFSLLAIPCLYAWSRVMLGKAGRGLAMALLCLSSSSIYYAWEFKPYSLDVLCALFLCLRFTAILERRAMAHAALDGALCIFAVFVSIPSFLIVAAGLATIGLRALWDRDRRTIFHIAAAALASAIFFGVQYKLAFAHHRDNESLYDYWIGLQAFPGTHSGLLDLGAFWVRSVFRALSDPVGLGDAWTSTTPATWLGAALFCLGVCSLRGVRAWLVLVPIALALLAATLRLFPFSGRVLLFLVPLFSIALGRGLDVVANAWPHRSRILAPILVIGLLVPSLTIGAWRTWKPLEREESREVVAEILEEAREVDGIYLTRFGRYAFEYYSRSHARNQPALIDAAWADGADSAVFRRSVRDRVLDRDRVWVFGTHLSADDHALEWSIEALSSAGGTIERQLEAPGVRAVRFDLRNLTR